MIERNNRALEKLSFRYYLKDNSRSSKENWKKAVKLLNYIEKRKLMIRRMSGLKTLDELTRKEYKTLLNTGMLYEFYPEATGDYRIDISQ